MALIADIITEAIGTEVLTALAATDVEPWNDPDTPGLAFTTGAGLKVTVTEEYGGTFTVYAADPNTMRTQYNRTGVTALELAEVVGEIA